MCGAVEVRSLLVVGGGPAGASAAAWPSGSCLPATSVYSFAPVDLAAHLITSNHLRDE